MLAAFARAALGTGLARRGQRVQSGIHHQSARQFAVGGQLAEHALAAVSRITNCMKTPVLAVSAQHAEHLDGQLRPCAISPPSAGRRLVIEIQAEQDRQAEGPLGPERKLHDHAQHDPTVSPVGDRLAAAGKQWIVMHAHAKHLQAALAGQRVVDSHQNLLLPQQRLQEAKHRQAQRVERPRSLGEEAMKGRMMPLAGHASRHQHSSDSPPPGEDPAGRDRHEILERGLRHHHGQLLQQERKRSKKIHGSLRDDAWLFT